MNQKVQVWTIQIAKWRVAKQRDIFFLDTTAKSGMAAFAPDFSDVMRYKRGEMDEEEYTRIYIERMEQSKIRYPLRWESLVKRPRIAFACYCKPGQFCHRHLFLDIVEKHFAPLGYEITRMGELE